MSKIAEYTNFSLKHFNENNAGTRIKPELKEQLLIDINKQLNSLTTKSNVGDFCIYVTLNNSYGIKSAIAPLIKIKKRWIKTDYISRSENELPVLTRVADVPFWFKIKESNNIVVVLYSKDQLLKEHTAFSEKHKSTEEFELSSECDYGIVTILTSEQYTPDPMLPITMMRNALGIDEGGNGVKLNKDEYNYSVNFWKEFILIRKTNKLF